MFYGARSGRYGASPSEIPESILEAYKAKDPEWDWFAYGDFVVLRMFDEGKETERVIAKIQKNRFVG